MIATFINALGETLPSIAGMLIDTVLDDAVQVPIPSTLYQITGVNLYEADVATGAAAPAAGSYALVGTFQPLTTATILPPPPGRLLPWLTGPEPPATSHPTRHRSPLCQHRLHQPQRKLEPHGRGLHLGQRGCARLPTVHGEYSHWPGQHHQPDDWIYGGGRHQRGSVLLYSLGHCKRRHPDDCDSDRRQRHHHGILQLHR